MQQTELRLQRQWEEIQPSAQSHTWDSLLGEHADGDLIFVPLTQSAALLQETIAMRHCVHAYDHRCVQGQSRIFSVRKTGASVATAEIIHTSQGWKTGQVRAKKNHPAEPDIREACARLARRYDQAAWQHTAEETAGSSGQALAAAYHDITQLPD